jgi:hypothetical protein
MTPFPSSTFQKTAARFQACFAWVSEPLFHRLDRNLFSGLQIGYFSDFLGEQLDQRAGAAQDRMSRNS